MLAQNAKNTPILGQINCVAERYEEDSGLRGSGEPEVGPMVAWINDMLARYSKPLDRAEEIVSCRNGGLGGTHRLSLTSSIWI